MRDTLQYSLLRREVGSPSFSTGIRRLYGDKNWVQELDIVNELGGHSGCVNALSWSKSGQLLASGSDDRYLNIYSYLPENSTLPFKLSTTVWTGHTANIFSVKFMPHSNDATIVTCAGDAEVRVFDIEYSTRTRIPSTAASYASSDQGRRRYRSTSTTNNGMQQLNSGTMYDGVQHLNDNNTNCRVYRSHDDRVKRIVTESSPHLFLTCSEDGEVRQWDIRLPSSSYPPSSGSRALHGRRRREEASNVPPPLISYKRFNIDLNSISCSASQPHYIVLGGAHLHCFLHDRRMIGRDLSFERGKPGVGNLGGAERDDDLMGTATRCVRRFAPNGQAKMRRTDSGHVTAAKISDANPNEMVASWSGDYIYSFDLLRSPDARSTDASTTDGLLSASSRRAKESRDRKRKRRQEHSVVSAEGANRGETRPRTEDIVDSAGDLALRVRYDNGQSEDIPLSATVTSSDIEQGRESLMSESEKRSLQIAKSVVKIRKHMFSLDASVRQTGVLISHTSSFTTVLGFAATNYLEMDDIMRSWRYPIDPDLNEVIFQRTLKANRESSRRFLQAAGTLARVLGGSLKSADSGSILEKFQEIMPLAFDNENLRPGEKFNYNFLRAILLWLEGGHEWLTRGFRRPPNGPKTHSGYPIPSDTDHSSVQKYLIPYLLDLAQNKPIPNVDTSRFEIDETRQIFATDTAAVVVFSRAIELPFKDTTDALATSSATGEQGEASQSKITEQSRQTATRYWALKVGRGLLMNAGEGINFAFVDHAFGGLGLGSGSDEGRSQEDVDTASIDPLVESLSVVRRLPSHGEPVSAIIEPEEAHVLPSPASGDMRRALNDDISVEGENTEDERILVDDLRDEVASQILHYHSTEEEPDFGSGIGEEEEEGEATDDDEDEEDDDDSDAGLTVEESNFIYTSAFDRGKRRERVEADVPCGTHTRLYRGHCNVKTVKDVNFFGLNDEYVVSGSDCGNLFIWDRKTSELLNILEGDGEVVNVIQGHPYEPVLAVSGIDHTIKIFSPDSRAQYDARKGVGLNTSGNASSNTSTLGGRRRAGENTDDAAANAGNEDQTNIDNTGDDGRVANGGLTSRKRMHDSYRITTQNDVSRQGGLRAAYITQDILWQFAAMLRARGQGDAVDAVEEERGVVEMNENCSIM